jgi:hypothetical protein
MRLDEVHKHSSTIPFDMAFLPLLRPDHDFVVLELIITGLYFAYSLFKPCRHG